MTPKDLVEDTMICYRDARRMAFGAPVLLVLVVYARAWKLDEPISFLTEVAVIGAAALIYLLGEIRCEIIRSDIRRQRQEDGF